MDEMHRLPSTSKFDQNEDDDDTKGEYDADDEQNANGDNVVTDRAVETPDKFLHEAVSVVQTPSTKTHSKTGFNIELGTNNDNLKVEPYRIPAEPMDSIFDDSGDTKLEQKTECKHLNEYLNEHERFLKLINHTRQLSLYEQKQLDRQKEDLKKLQKKLAKQIEENDRKRLYKQKKEEDNLRKRRAYLQRRVEEAKLKEIRKPRIQTTFHTPIEEKRSKSQVTQKKTKGHKFDPSSSSAMSQPKSISTYISDTDSATISRYQNNVECQTDTNHSHKLLFKHRLDKFDTHIKEQTDDVDKNLEELIVQFVEHSKRSWINE